jgi:hypothetical protein
MVRASLAMVSNNLETAKHLASGEETDALGENHSASGELGGANIAGALDDGTWGLEDAASLNRAEDVLVVVLESGNRGRVHLLAAEDNLGNLKTDLGVVYHERCLTCRPKTKLA